MARTFYQMLAEAKAEVPGITPAEAERQREQDPRTLVVDVRDAADVKLTGLIPGAVNITYGTLTYKADQEVPEEWRDPRLQDRSRPIITTCDAGPLGALGAKLLKDMGFVRVAFIEGGVLAWQGAGLPTDTEADRGA